MRLEARAKETLPAMFVIAFAMIAIGAAAFAGADERTAAAVLWIAFAFGGLTAISRSFSIEKDRGTMVSLLMAPAERFELFLGKAFSNLLAVFFLELFAAPAFVLLFHYEPPALPGSIIVIVVLGTVGLVVTGSVLAAIAAASRSRELLMPVLLFPVMFPVFLVAVPATASALRGARIDELLPGIGLLAGYDMVMLALSLLLFEYTVEG